MSNIQEKSWVRCINALESSSFLEEGMVYWAERFNGTASDEVFLEGEDLCSWFKHRFVPSSYQEAQEASGLKVGDRVKITRRAESYEKGWRTVWDNGNMNKMVGKEGVILNVSSADNGFLINNKWYPFFILEKVNQNTNVENKPMNEPVKYLVKNKWEAAALQAVLDGNKRIKDECKYHNPYSEKSYSIFAFDSSVGFAGLGSAVDKSTKKEISLSEMLTLVGEYGFKPLPEVIAVGGYKTEWKLNEETNKIDKVKIGCQTIDVEVVKRVAAAIEEFNKE